jgi:hypothetical protein
VGDILDIVTFVTILFLVLPAIGGAFGALFMWLFIRGWLKRKVLDRESGS